MSKDALKRFAEEMVERLMPIGPIETKPMFGAIALRRDGVMFGFVHDTDFFLKVDDAGMERLESLGGVPFSYAMGEKTMTSRSTWSVPAEILDDPAELIELAERAVVVATESKAKRPPRKRKAG